MNVSVNIIMVFHICEYPERRVVTPTAKLSRPATSGCTGTGLNTAPALPGIFFTIPRGVDYCTVWVNYCTVIKARDLAET